MTGPSSTRPTRGNKPPTRPSKGHEQPGPDNAIDKEQQLVAAASDGDHTAFEHLVATHGDRLYGFMLHMAAGDEDLAAELTQEAFVRAWEKLSLFAGKCRFYTWLYRLARNRCLDYLAKSKPRAMEQETLEAIAPGVDDPDVLANEELRIRVREAIGRLLPDQREIILLRDFEGLDYSAIAERLECVEGTVKSRLFRARLALRHQLAHLDPGDL